MMCVFGTRNFVDLDKYLKVCKTLNWNNNLGNRLSYGEYVGTCAVPTNSDRQSLTKTAWPNNFFGYLLLCRKRCLGLGYPKNSIWSSWGENYKNFYLPYFLYYKPRGLYFFDYPPKGAYIRGGLIFEGGLILFGSRRRRDPRKILAIFLNFHWNFDIFWNFN